MVSKAKRVVPENQIPARGVIVNSRLTNWLLTSVFLAFLFTMIALGSSVSAAKADCPPTFLGGVPNVSKVSQTSLVGFKAFLSAGCTEAHWTVEYSTSETGPWTAVPGGAGTVAANASVKIEGGELTGLTPETVYYFRFTATNSSSSTEVHRPEPPEPPAQVETVTLRPRSFCCSLDHVTGNSVLAHGQVNPDNSETHWRFEYAASQSALENGTGTVGAEGVIPQSEADEEFHQIEGNLGGLSENTTYYIRIFAENVHGQATLNGSDLKSFETGGTPQINTFASHSVQNGALRALGYIEPRAYDTHYYAEYLTQESLEAGGWAAATQSPVSDAGTGEYSGLIEGFPAILIGADLPGLIAGKTYHYRLVGENEKGKTVGGEDTLVVPGPISEEVPACPNEQLRSGPSARLPDCRSYEQVTPADKQGTMDLDTYGGVIDEDHVAEDGERLMLTAPGAQFGSSPDSKRSTYIFTRTPNGWQLGSVTPQPEAGGNSYAPYVFSTDLTTIALEIGWKTTHIDESSNVEFVTGPAGGPYTPIVTAARTSNTKLLAGSDDAGKVILGSEDYDLLGHQSGTTSGADLYEFFENKLRQVNVSTSGKELGICGAWLPKGIEGYQETEVQVEPESSSPHVISDDNSKVFFEAVPGVNGCGETSHLYARVNGAETVDIGPYVFLAANSQGTELLLEKNSGQAQEFFTYDFNSKVISSLFSTAEPVQRPIASSELTSFYFRSKERLTPEAPPTSIESVTISSEDIYHYDINDKVLSYVAQAALTGGFGGGYSVTPNGRYLYFASVDVGGVPGGGSQSVGEHTGPSDQVYRYDSVENDLQCMSCASPFNPEPKLSASFLFGPVRHGDGIPDPTISSADGNYVFFDTPSALVSQDVDGELPPSTPGYIEFVRSPSSDTYEWRRYGVNGCGRLEGCISLISGGIGGYKTELIGTTSSGNDVFFATHETLVSQDVDKAGDIYDARIGGGYPPVPPLPVECEGDACSSPIAAPIDTSPASLSFSGPGNENPPVVMPKAKQKAKQKSCKKGTELKKGKCVKVRKKRSKTPARKRPSMIRQSGASRRGGAKK